MQQFQWAAGSIIGSEHQRVNKNNQDALAVRSADDYLLGVVADGCGSCTHSEVGAWLAVELIAEAIAANPNAITDDDGCRELGEKVLRKLPPQLPAEKYYLFTLLGFVITPEETVVFGCGDGTLAINGEITRWEFANNAPPYLIYPTENLRIISRLPTENLESLLIGTDGLDDWQKYQELSDFWQQQKYFKNPDQVRRSLAIANKKKAVLRDDTSLISVRRNLEK